MQDRHAFGDVAHEVHVVLDDDEGVLALQFQQQFRHARITTQILRIVLQQLLVFGNFGIEPVNGCCISGFHFGDVLIQFFYFSFQGIAVQLQILGLQFGADQGSAGFFQAFGF